MSTADKCGPPCPQWRSMEKVGRCCCGLCRNKASAVWARSVLEVVVPLPDGLLSSEHRHGEIITVLDLLDELVPSAPPAWQGQLQMLAKQVRLALPQALLFARRLDAVQVQASRVLGAQAVALL